MTRLLRAVAVVLIAACLRVPVDASAGRWTQVRSANFLFIGDAAERDIRQVAQKLEQFRETLTRAFGELAARSPVPTIVFVFANDRSFTPYKPLFRGKPIAVGGFFNSGEDANYIALVPNEADDSYTIVFHEYTHFMVNNLVGTVPVWLNEGLAGFYETFEERDGGRIAILGAPSAQKIEALREKFMPLRELMAVQHSSPVYNEGDRRGIFYAESWALVHYLRNNQARPGQLSAYLNQIRSGADPAAAFTAAFNTTVPALEDELRAYLGRFTFPATQFTFDAKTGNGDVQPGVVIPETDAQAYLAELLMRMGRGDEAKAQLERLIAGNAGGARALSALGSLELSARHETGLALLERAAAMAPDDAWIQGLLGAALGDRVRQLRGDRAAHTDTLARARAVLAKAVTLTPVSASTLVALALVEMETGTNNAAAQTLLEEASRLAPSREHYKLTLAQALIAQEQFDRATQVIGPLMATASRPEVKESARDLLGRAATLRQAIAARNERLRLAASEIPPPVPPRGTAVASEPAVGPPPPAGASAAVARRLTPGRSVGIMVDEAGARLTLLLREMKPGESRVLGVFQAIDCTPGLFVLRLSVDGRPQRFTTPALNAVDFISYRKDPPTGITCGLQSAHRVLLTYRAQPAGGRIVADGEAVALELVPDTFALAPAPD
ncbi:MAG: DUF1570 domain-containing protein [Vicinamibacterales bacterium]